MKTSWRAALVVSAWVGVVCPASAQDAYFAIVWGAQRPFINVPRHSHTWATFARLCPDGLLEHFTISWLPVSGEIRPFSATAEAGRLWTLDQTIRFCGQNGMEVAAWGPYQIHKDLWDRALRQKTRLESGQVLYKAFEAGAADGTVMNCIHAVVSLTDAPERMGARVIVAPANWGESGSYWTALTLRPWYLEPCRTHAWIFVCLGVDSTTILHFGLSRNPTCNPVTRAVQAAFQFCLLPNRVNCSGW